MKALVTGANGSIGSALADRLEREHTVYRTDIDTLDVTSKSQAQEMTLTLRPDVIFHMAGAKHAPEGELVPERVAEVNIGGTVNMVHAANLVDAKLIVASTCKACDPETAYGASKLIAERVALNSGGVVVRFYNVRETSGNVLRFWEKIPEDQPIPFTECWRYFVSLEDVIDLCVDAIDLPSGRYTLRSGLPWHLSDLAHDVYPGRPQTVIARRRGDRVQEPLLASCETFQEAGRWRKIVSTHDLA